MSECCRVVSFTQRRAVPGSRWLCRPCVQAGAHQSALHCLSARPCTARMRFGTPPTNHHALLPHDALLCTVRVTYRASRDRVVLTPLSFLHSKMLNDISIEATLNGKANKREVEENARLSTTLYIRHYRRQQYLVRASLARVTCLPAGYMFC